MTTLTRALLALCAFQLVVMTSLVYADPPPKPTNRAEAVDGVRHLRRIVTPEGIDVAQAVALGGIKQWVTIRGSDRRNPVLLVLHGGPGYPELPLSW
jgi:proline iminopeptidase